MKNKKLKKEQRSINKIIRTFNKRIERDKFFLGRFVIQQVGRHYVWNSTDKILTIYLRLGDKKTGKYADIEFPTFHLHFFNEEQMSIYLDVFMKEDKEDKIITYLNKFIMEYCNWMTEPIDAADIDYRNIPFIPKEEVQWRPFVLWGYRDDRLD